MLNYRSTIFYVSNFVHIMPNDLIILILSYCDYKECIILKHTCHVFHKAIQILLNKIMIGTLETFPLQALREPDIYLFKQSTERISSSRPRSMKAIAMLHDDDDNNDQDDQNSNHNDDQLSPISNLRLSNQSKSKSDSIYNDTKNLIYKRIVILHQKEKSINEPLLKDFINVGYVAEIIDVESYNKYSSIKYEVRRLYPIEPIYLHNNGYQITVKRLKQQQVLERMNILDDHHKLTNEVNLFIQDEQQQEQQVERV